MLSKEQIKNLQEIQSKVSTIDDNIKKAKEQKRTMLTTIAETVTEEEKQEILAVAEKEFNPVKQRFETVKNEYDNALQKYNSVLELLNYRIKNSFGKVKNQITVTGNTATVIRDGKTATINLSGNWQKEATSVIEKVFACTNGTARNIIYKISLLLKHSKAQ